MGEKGAKWEIREQFIDKWVIELENCQYNDSGRVFNHCLPVIEKLACDREQREVIRPSVHEKLDCCMVDAQGERLKK